MPSFSKKVTCIKNIVVLLKQSISHKSVHWYQCLSLWKILDGECLVHDKEKFVLKTHFLQKVLYFLKSNDFFGLIQSPNISKHISRNGGATIKASRKTAHDKVFFSLGQKDKFWHKKMAAPSKKSYSPKYVYWYQCFSVWKMVGAKSLVHGTRFRHSIDSHCL